LTPQEEEQWNKGGAIEIDDKDLTSMMMPKNQRNTHTITLILTRRVKTKTEAKKTTAR
jgi:hypothetical protein